MRAYFWIPILSLPFAYSIDAQSTDEIIVVSDVLQFESFEL